MGAYNPHLPYILGQEWVPIRNEDYQYLPDATTRENGYGFTLATSRQLNSARFYTSSLPIRPFTTHVAGINIYPRGKEDQTGPIRKVIIPMNNGAITGGTGGSGPYMFLNNAATLAEALATPGDLKNVESKNNNTADALSGQFYSFFAVNDYAAVLQNKRILNVTLLYAGNVNDSNSNGNFSFISPYTGKNQLFQPTTVIYGSFVNSVSSTLGTSFTTLDPSTGSGILGSLGELGGTIVQLQQKIARLSLGDANIAANNAAVQNSTGPWTYNGLKRLDFRNGLDGFIQFTIQVPLSSYDFSPTGLRIILDYVALEVTYCEETRVAAGARSLGYTNGLNYVPMSDLNLNSNPILAAGDYTVTLGWLDAGDKAFAIDDLQGPYPSVNALREKYALNSMPGLQVNVPFPLNDHVGEAFTKVSSSVIPQISLHASGGQAPFVEPHAYGRQIAAQVYGTNNAIQNVLSAPVGANATFPWVRFYARRFGSTTAPLKFEGINDNGLILPGTVGDASTPDNAALDITGDIDLRIGMQLDDWTPSVIISPLTKWGNAGTRSYLLQIDTAGKLGIVWSTDGTNTLVAVSTIPIPVADGQQIAVRATLDVDNGAGGKTATFYTAPSINGAYTQFGSAVTTAGTTSIFSGSAPVEVGGHTGGTADLFPGSVQAARILNGIAGTQVANPDFSSQATGTTSFTDAAGRVWTITGSASIRSPDGGSNVSITPAAFDQLPEILDGWKEVTLRFNNPPIMGFGASPSWKWSAAGELPGNRWEVMGAMAPAVSGGAGFSGGQATLNPYTNPAPPIQQLSLATYGQPTNGALCNLTWLAGFAPPVSSPTADPWTDAVLLFSQDMPAVSGFTVVTANQPLTGVALNCTSYPWYVPTSMSYNQLSWNLPTGYVLDTFSTPAVSGWSPADTGQTWTSLGPDIGSYSVAGGVGVVTMGIRNTGYNIALSSLGTPDQDLTVYTKYVSAVTGSGGQYVNNLKFRRADDNNCYVAEIVFIPASDGLSSVFLIKVVAGVPTVLGSFTTAVPVGHSFGLRGSAIGNQIQLKMWDATTSTEPGSFQISVTDSSLTTGNTMSIEFFLNSSTTNTLPYIANVDNLQSNLPPFGYLEIQRSDTINTDWATIAQVTSPATTIFRDYEARVNIQSSYRIRGVNSMNFAGPWSSTVSNLFAAPGVTGVGMNSNTRALLFTSNNRQNGSRNLAYSLAYSSDATDTFNFPEAAFTQFQFMYGRDYQTAFRPLERGGSTFQRTVLVQAAAIPAPTLPNFVSIRDLGWDSLPYVCVRDEDGNRWLANVQVPQGRIQGNNRTIYFVDLTITEITNTPAIVVI